MNIKLTDGAIGKALFYMALPMVIGILCTMSFNIVDTMLVAGLGQDALAALSFTFPVAMIAMALSIGMGAGTSTVVSIAAGKEDHQTVKEYITDGLLLTSFLSILLAIIGFIFNDAIFTSLGASESLLPLIQDYMYIFYGGILTITVPMVAMACLRGLGNTKMQGKLMMGTALANVALDPLLIYGWGPFPRLEIQGAALASLIVRLVMVVIVYHFIQRKMQLLTRISFSRLLHSTRQIMRVGVPAMATNLIVPLSATFITKMVASYGEVAVAGAGAAIKVESIALIFFYALSSIVGPFCGQNLGAQKFDRISQMQRLTASFCVITGIVMTALLFITRGWIARLFSDDSAVIEVIKDYLLIIPVSYFGYGIVMVVNASFNGLSKPMPGMFISLTRVILLLLPLAMFMSHLYALNGIFISIAISNAVVGIAAYFWVQHTVKKLSVN